MPEDNWVRLEAGGENCVDNIKTLLSIIALTGDIDEVAVEVKSNEPIETLQKRVDDLQDIDVKEDETEPEEQMVSEGGDEEEAKTICGIKKENISIIQKEGDPFTILSTLFDNDERHYHMNEVKEMIPSDELRAESLSNSLYALAERGLIDKQPSEQDQRKNKYKITTKGEAAVLKVKENE